MDYSFPSATLGKNPIEIDFGWKFSQGRMTPRMIARRFIVKGKVQGVGFRYFAIRAARESGVDGTVRNLEDGSVEAIAEGSPLAIDQFRAALQRGPSHARVAEVVETVIPATGQYSGFDVRF